MLGALAKETFVPLAGVFTFGWWLSSQRRASDRMRKLFWGTAMIITGIVTIIITRLAISATLGGGHSLDVALRGLGVLSQSNPGPGYLSRLGTALSSRSFWYVFIWLLPLGIAGLRRLPRTWVIASVASAVIALVLGLYRNIEGNLARPIFDVLGPMLSLSAAIWLSRSLVERETLRVD
jgi:hypothetical protein